jgi:hypothetical protein
MNPCGIHITIANFLSHDTVNLVTDLRRCTRRLNLSEQVKYAVEHELLLPFISTGYPRRIQRLAQETRIAIQIVLHL